MHDRPIKYTRTHVKEDKKTHKTHTQNTHKVVKYIV